MTFTKIWRQTLLFLILATLLTLSTPVFLTTKEKARLIAGGISFDYFSWDLNAFAVKLAQTGVLPAQRLTPDQQHTLVVQYFNLTSELERLQAQLQQVYSNPAIADPEVYAQTKLARQQELQKELTSLTPLAEDILQKQVNAVLVSEGIVSLGSAVPPVLFHTTPLPKALIVSPRDQIQQDANISLLADLTLEQIASLENQIEIATGGSALVVDVGGIGIYPTMVMRSSNLPWIIGTITHEWTHNYLEFFPLGLNYDLTPELRTMNETTASIVGSEISQEVLERFYPEYTALSTQDQKVASLWSFGAPFDYRIEMHKTRVRVDELLVEGKVDEAERYMEERRIVFVNHGYNIRKLNQAYFAFYGAYADRPGGAAGEDPVGPAVRELRAQSESLSDFLRAIAKMNSFEDLQAAISKK